MPCLSSRRRQTYYFIVPSRLLFDVFLLQQLSSEYTNITSNELPSFFNATHSTSIYHEWLCRHSDSSDKMLHLLNLYLPSRKEKSSLMTLHPFTCNHEESSYLSRYRKDDVEQQTHRLGIKRNKHHLFQDLLPAADNETTTSYYLENDLFLWK